MYSFPKKCVTGLSNKRKKNTVIIHYAADKILTQKKTSQAFEIYSD